MKIIDAQIHLWTKENAVVVPPHRTEPFGIEEALREMDAAGVHGAIVHPPHWDPDSHALAIEAATRWPDRFAILGRIEPDDPDRLERLSTWTSQPGVRGLRYTFLEPHEKAWLDDGTLDWLWPAAEELGIPVALLADGFLPQFARLADRHRQGRNAAQPTRRPGARDPRHPAPAPAQFPPPPGGWGTATHAHTTVGLGFSGALWYSFDWGRRVSGSPRARIFPPALAVPS